MLFSKWILIRFSFFLFLLHLLFFCSCIDRMPVSFIRIGCWMCVFYFSIICSFPLSPSLLFNIPLYVYWSGPYFLKIRLSFSDRPLPPSSFNLKKGRRYEKNPREGTFCPLMLHSSLKISTFPDSWAMDLHQEGNNRSDPKWSMNFYQMRTSLVYAL